MNEKKSSTHSAFSLVLRTRELSIQLLGSEMYGDFVLGSTGDTLLEALSRVSMHIAHCTVHEGNEGRKTHQLVKNTAVQGHLGLSAFPQVLVVILETFPVRHELFQAVGVDILDPAHHNNTTLACTLLHSRKQGEHTH